MGLSDQFFHVFNKYLSRSFDGLSITDKIKLQSLKLTIASYDCMISGPLKLQAAVDWAYSICGCFSENTEGELIEGFLSEDRMRLVRAHFSRVELINMHRMAKKLVEVNKT